MEKIIKKISLLFQIFSIYNSKEFLLEVTMKVVKLSEHSVKMLAKFMKFLDEREKELNDYLTILLDLQDVVAHVDPQRLLRLLAGYPKQYLQVIRMKAGIAAKLLTWEKEYDNWYAGAYLDSVKLLEDAKKGETTDDGKGSKPSTGKILKDHITNYVKNNFFDEINQYMDTINELKVQLQMMEDIVRMFQNMNQAFRALADLREIWRPFVPDSVYTGQDVQKDQTAQVSEGTPATPGESPVLTEPMPPIEPSTDAVDTKEPKESIDKS